MTPEGPRKRIRSQSSLVASLVPVVGQFVIIAPTDSATNDRIRVGKIEEVSQVAGRFMVSWLRCSSLVANVHSSFTEADSPDFQPVAVESVLCVFSALGPGGQLPEYVLGQLQERLGAQ